MRNRKKAKIVLLFTNTLTKMLHVNSAYPEASIGTATMLPRLAYRKATE